MLRVHEAVGSPPEDAVSVKELLEFLRNEIEDWKLGGTCSGTLCAIGALEDVIVEVEKSI